MKFFSIANIVFLRSAFLTLLGLAAIFGQTASPVSAQELAWIQVESKNNIRETKERAQFFSIEFPDTHAFLTSTGWYAIVIGPMSRDLANDELQRLKDAQEIPSDSFVTDGAAHGSQLWPLAATTVTTGATEIAEAGEETLVAEASAATVMIEEPVGPIKDENLKETRKNERSWTRDQKKLYQTYMVWTGDYQSAIDGSYGRGTRKAIKSFQVREGFEDTGFLTELQIAKLEAQYNNIISTLGLENLRDLDAGIEIKYPSNLVKFGGFEAPFVNYSEIGNSGVKMMLISQEGGRKMLASLYDIMETFDYIPSDGYRVRKRDWFVLSGRDENVVSYTYVRHQKGHVKGFTLVWPPARDVVMQPLATAMYNSFTPLDEYVLDETLGYGQSEDQPTDLTSGLETPSPDSAASGFFINSDGTMLTHTANIAACKRLTINEGTVEFQVFAKNPKLALAVLKPTTSYTPASFALFSDEALELGAEITVAGFSFPEVMEIATLNYGTLTDVNGLNGNERAFRVSAFLEAGDTGGPVLDDRGAVIGLQLPKSSAETGFAEYVNFALKSGLILELLDRHELEYGKSTAFDTAHGEDVAFMAGDFTVKVSCWK